MRFGSIFFKCGLGFPPASAIDASHITGHRLIRRPHLLQIVCALLGLALAACEGVRRCLDCRLKFVLVFDALQTNQLIPLFGTQLLVRHECDLVRLNFPSVQLFYDRSILQIDKHTSQMIDIKLDEITVVPLLDNLAILCLLQGVIINTLLQIQ